MAWVVADRADAPDGVHLTLSEEAAAFSKTLIWPSAVPGLGSLDGRPIQILGVRLEVTTTATAGARRPLLELWDSSTDIVYSLQPAGTAAANGTTIFEFLAGGIQGDATVEPAGTVVRSTMPDENMDVMPGGALSILADGAALDTSDTVVVHVRARVPRLR